MTGKIGRHNLHVKKCANIPIYVSIWPKLNESDDTNVYNYIRSKYIQIESVSWFEMLERRNGGLFFGEEVQEFICYHFAMKFA